MQPGLSKFKFMAGRQASNISAKRLTFVLQGDGREKNAHSRLCVNVAIVLITARRERVGEIERGRKNGGRLCGRTTR